MRRAANARLTHPVHVLAKRIERVNISDDELAGDEVSPFSQILLASAELSDELGRILLRICDGS